MVIEYEHFDLIDFNVMYDLLFKEEHPVRERRWFHLRNIACQHIISDHPAYITNWPVTQECLTSPKQFVRFVQTAYPKWMALLHLGHIAQTCKISVSVTTLRGKIFANKFFFFIWFFLWFLLTLNLFLHLAVILRLSTVFLFTFISIWNLYISFWTSTNIHSRFSWSHLEALL